MPRLNPFRFAKIYLAKSEQDIEQGLMHSVHGALEMSWLRSPNRGVSRQAINHFKKMVHPHLSERAWLINNVLGFTPPSVQDMQDYRHRWLDHMAQQWDKGEIS